MKTITGNREPDVIILENARNYKIGEVNWYLQLADLKWKLIYVLGENYQFNYIEYCLWTVPDHRIMRLRKSLCKYSSNYKMDPF